MKKSREKRRWEQWRRREGERKYDVMGRGKITKLKERETVRKGL